MRCASTPTSSEQGGALLLPIYLVCDLSSSMSGAQAAALADAIRELRDAVWANPVVSDCARVGVIGFATSAWTIIPLCDLGELEELPALAPHGLTSYAAAFALLKATIDHDAAQLRADGFRLWRPLVFFISDGEPTDPVTDWLAEHARLVDRRQAWRPDVVAFAVGTATATTLARVATARCFAAERGHTVSSAIAEIADVVLRSVVASGATGAPVAPPSPPAGFEEVDLV
ncbi:hypothetical protein GCM10023148_01870 [Actinokineospora soli]